MKKLMHILDLAARIIHDHMLSALNAFYLEYFLSDFSKKSFAAANVMKLSPKSTSAR